MLVFNVVVSPEKTLTFSLSAFPMPPKDLFLRVSSSEQHGEGGAQVQLGEQRAIVSEKLTIF